MTTTNESVDVAKRFGIPEADEKQLHEAIKNLQKNLANPPYPGWSPAAQDPHIHDKTIHGVRLRTGPVRVMLEA